MYKHIIFPDIQFGIIVDEMHTSYPVRQTCRIGRICMSFYLVLILPGIYLVSAKQNISEYIEILWNMQGHSKIF